MKKDVYKVSSDGLVDKVKEAFRDVDVKRVVVKDEKGRCSCPFPSPGVPRVRWLR